MAPPNGETKNIDGVLIDCDRKRLHGATLDGAKHFQKNCQNVPGAAGAAVGAAAASAVCIYYVTSFEA